MYIVIIIELIYRCLYRISNNSLMSLKTSKTEIKINGPDSPHSTARKRRLSVMGESLAGKELFERSPQPIASPQPTAPPTGLRALRRESVGGGDAGTPHYTLINQEDLKTHLEDLASAGGKPRRLDTPLKIPSQPAAPVDTHPTIVPPVEYISEVELFTHGMIVGVDRAGLLKGSGSMKLSVPPQPQDLSECMDPKVSLCIKLLWLFVICLWLLTVYNRNAPFALNLLEAVLRMMLITGSSARPALSRTARILRTF